MFLNLRRFGIIKYTLGIKNWGIKQDTPANEIRSIRLLNYICLIGVITGFFYSIIFLFLGNYIPAILDTVLVSLFLPSLILNKKLVNELIQNGKLFNNKETYPYYLNDNRITDDIKLFKFPTINWIRGNYTYDDEEDTYESEDGIYISNDTVINNRLKIFLDELNRLDF